MSETVLLPEAHLHQLIPAPDQVQEAHSVVDDHQAVAVDDQAAVDAAEVNLKNNGKYLC